ncbi:MAG: hypothetical protein E3J83_01280 [Candidatus Atribacteria bacterium]|nr:MAG: hypothetical protein E3J83_01280 [Candidatus Atribacteria bacterium]
MANKLTDKTIRSFVLGLIIFKPIFDLDWRWPLFFIGTTPVPFHRIVAILVPIMIIILASVKTLSGNTIYINNNKYLFFFLILVTISTIINASLNSLDEYFRILSFITIFLLFPILLQDVQKFYKVAKIIFLVSIIPTLISYFQAFNLISGSYIDYLPYIGKIGRITGGYHHPTGYLNYILVLVPLAIYLYHKGVMSKIFFWPWVIFTIPMLIRSFHRATLIIIFLVLVFYILFNKKIWLKITSIIFFSILLAFSFNYIWAFINQGDALTGFAFRGRENIWPIYIDHFQSSSFYQRIVGLGNPYLLSGANEPHSDWLRILYNYGYLGIILYILFLVNVFIIFIRKLLKIKKKNWVESEAFLGIILVIIIILYSITMEPLRYSSFSWIYALVLGFLYAKTCKHKKIFIKKHKVMEK